MFGTARARIVSGSVVRGIPERDAWLGVGDCDVFWLLPLCGHRLASQKMSTKLTKSSSLSSTFSRGARCGIFARRTKFLARTQGDANVNCARVCRHQLASIGMIVAFRSQAHRP
jgi:hypothetical protein